MHDSIRHTPDNGVIVSAEAQIDLVIGGVCVTCVVHSFVYNKERERDRIKSIEIWIFCILNSDPNLK